MSGVLWHLEKPIPGAMEALKRLQELGKKVYLVTNNSTTSTEQYSQKIRKLGLVIHPVSSCFHVHKIINDYKIQVSSELRERI